MKISKKIKIVRGDITKLNVDAIVNAANSRLAGGGGVDGAIHRAAGAELPVACQKLNGCTTGSSKLTLGFKLPSKYIIHTVGPVWRGGNSGEKELLESCYKTCLDIAIENNIKSIAFPNVSTGIYGYPKNEASEIAVETVTNFISNSNVIEEVVFVCFDAENFEIYSKRLKLY